jgi:hypothetical protein
MLLLLLCSSVICALETQGQRLSVGLMSVSIEATCCASHATSTMVAQIQANDDVAVHPIA